MEDNTDPGAGVPAEIHTPYMSLKAKRSQKVRATGGPSRGSGRRRPRSNRKRRRRSLSARLSNPSYRSKAGAINSHAEMS